MSSQHSGIWEVNIDLQTELLSKDDLRDIKLMSLEVIFLMLFLISFRKGQNFCIITVI